MKITRNCEQDTTAEANTESAQAPASHIIEGSGLTRDQIRETARIAMGCERIICCWAMGLTQHKNAVASIQGDHELPPPRRTYRPAGSGTLSRARTFQRARRSNHGHLGANVLVPINSTADRSNTPTSKSLVISIKPSPDAGAALDDIIRAGKGCFSLALRFLCGLLSYDLA